MPMSQPVLDLATRPPNARQITWWPKQMPRTRLRCACRSRISRQSRRIHSSSAYASFGLPLITKPSYFSTSPVSGSSPSTARYRSHVSPASPNAATKTFRYPPYLFRTYSESRAAIRSANRLLFFPGAAFAIIATMADDRSRSTLAVAVTQ
ncbi:hypothetical protein PR202_gb22584 [Eleusine coracana subsp. coracana]|uniref:Uncharacterized protein n=1 Tax=Eleusine coracana subsp. coracana TaxID=191504 RepID=A0AAV5FH27_ELECO|nr:hypothetical protein PR202_gb22584 [Eleusine coracana subsp. coracana]